MPWNTRGKMSLKEEFILKVLNKENTLSKLAKEFGVSRQTAYKWLKRFKEEGICGLQERSKRPAHFPSQLCTEQVEVILEARDKNPAWGGKKLRQMLINEGAENLPSVASFNRVLKRHNRIGKEESEKREHYIRFEREKPNELWQMDFKGYFRVQEGKCYPLTVLDDHSRFSICIQACKSEDEISVRKALEEAFREYGLPEAMTMDNGSPWKGSPGFRLSRLTVWLMRLGIKVGHSTPYHPQTQGKDERFHRSLKEEVLRFHQFKDLTEAQEHFNEWRYKYNFVRPHEGIGMARPIDRYAPSHRHFPSVLPSIEYEKEDIVRKVRTCGQVSFNGKEYFIGEHFHGEYVAFRQTGAHRWDIYFCKTRITGFHLKV
jgi:transposase InsO family protein